MQLIKPLYWILAATCLAVTPVHAAEEVQSTAPETKGPHGGLLLTQDDTIVELQIFEQGVPRNTVPG